MPEVRPGEAYADRIIVPQGKTFSAAKAEVIADFGRRYLTRLLQDSGGNVSLAARLAGKERHTLRRLRQKYGLVQSSSDESSSLGSHGA